MARDEENGSVPLEDISPPETVEGISSAEKGVETVTPTPHEDVPESATIGEPDPTDVKSKSRFRRLLRKFFYGLAIFLLVVAAGWLTAYMVLYRPAARALNQANREIEEANQRITELEDQVATFSSLQDKNQILQEELDAARLHILLLRILADVNASRLALTADDPNSAYLFLKLTQDRLHELGNLLGSEHSQVVEAMQKRLELVASELKRAPVIAQSDLDVLADALLQLESIFSIP